VLACDFRNSVLLLALVLIISICDLLDATASLVLSQAIFLATTAWAAHKLFRLARLRTETENGALLEGAT
jgi:hypothetical protein